MFVPLVLLAVRPLDDLGERATRLINRSIFTLFSSIAAIAWLGWLGQLVGFPPQILVLVQGTNRPGRRPRLPGPSWQLVWRGNHHRELVYLYRRPARAARLTRGQ